MFGGLVLGQKFTMDKVVMASGVKPKLADDADEDDVYTWTSPTNLKGATEISVVCQKGQKSPTDPTPNQDNYFVQFINGVACYGVCDGHGPFGHLVSFRLVQTLPHFIAKSPHFGKDWERCLREAFLDAQADLLGFCQEQQINVEASGAASSVAIHEEQSVHIAHIGDARIMVGSWNRHDSRMIHCTKDHKPNVPEEQARLEAAGSEVREIEPDNHRVYLPGQTFPGLTMSRAHGDTACGGVSQEPEYFRVVMQPMDEWFMVVASDGIWEFMDGEEVCKLASKKLRLKGPRETMQFLLGASRKRWVHCCGEYCDDITGILVQWNSKGMKDIEDNFKLEVRRATCQQ